MFDIQGTLRFQDIVEGCFFLFKIKNGIEHGLRRMMGGLIHIVLRELVRAPVLYRECLFL